MTRLFGDVERVLRDLTSPRTLHDLHNLAGAALHREVMVGFEREMDPDGHPWIPSKAATREGRRTLRDSGNLQDGIEWLADSRRVILKTTGAARRQGYDVVHQYGSTRMNDHRQNGQFMRKGQAMRSKKVVPVSDVTLPARPFMPEPGSLPPRFERAVSNEFRAYLRARFGTVG